MARELYDYFVKAEEIGGIKARTRLSFLTQTSSLQAKSLTDSEENRELFKTAFEEVSKEFSNDPEPLVINKVEKTSCGDVTIQLRKMINGFVDLVAQRALFQNNFKAIMERITETIAYSLDLERVSIWFIDKEQNSLICEDLFILSKTKHTDGMEIKIADCPSYFEAIAMERTLPVSDVFKDKRTKELLDDYLKPLNIYSLMDVPIWSEGKMIGVICFENVGSHRKWTADEENFAYLMSNIISMAEESTGHHK